MCTTDRHDELVALLTEIRDRLPGPECVRDEPVDVTEEPPVGSQVTDREGDVWKRREEGWALWWPERSGWLADLDGWGDDPWPVVRKRAPLRPTTDEDRKRVGLPTMNTPEGTAPGDTAPNVDPDEALARVLEAADERTATWLGMAREVRKHIEVERDESQQADAWLRIVRHPVIASVPVPRDGRSFVEAVMDHLTDLQEDVERLTRERDDLTAEVAAKAWDEGYAVGEDNFIHSDYCGRRCQCQGLHGTTNPYLTKRTEPAP